MADKFVQIKDGSGSNIFPNLNASPFVDTFFTTSTISNRARITLTTSVMRNAACVDPDSNENVADNRVGRVQTVSGTTLQSCIEKLAAGTREGYWSNAYTVPTVEAIASCYSSAFLDDYSRAQIITSVLAKGATMPAASTCEKFAVFYTSNQTALKKNLSGAWKDMQTKKNTVYIYNCRETNGKYIKFLVTCGENGTSLVESQVNEARNTQLFQGMTVADVRAHDCNSAASAGKTNSITLTSAQYATSAKYAASAQIADDLPETSWIAGLSSYLNQGVGISIYSDFYAQHGGLTIDNDGVRWISGAGCIKTILSGSTTEVTSGRVVVSAPTVASVLSGLAGFDGGKVLLTSTNTAKTLYWGDAPSTGGGDSTIQVLKSLSNHDTAGYVLKISNNANRDLYWASDLSGGNSSTIYNCSCTLANYACNGESSVSGVAGKVATLCGARLIDVYNTYVTNGTFSGAGELAAAYVVPTAEAVCVLVAHVITNGGYGPISGGGSNPYG